MVGHEIINIKTDPIVPNTTSMKLLEIMLCCNT